MEIYNHRYVIPFMLMPDACDECKSCANCANVDDFGVCGVWEIDIDLSQVCMWWAKRKPEPYWLNEYALLEEGGRNYDEEDEFGI